MMSPLCIAMGVPNRFGNLQITVYEYSIEVRVEIKGNKKPFQNEKITFTLEGL